MSLTDFTDFTVEDEPDDEDPGDIVELGLSGADDTAERGATVAELAKAERLWRFGHVIVDEAQDLTPMQWRMIERRSLAGSMTIVGDLAQRSIGNPGSWADHLPPALAQDFAYQELTINYRSPTELNELAQRLLSILAPELTPSVGIRASGHPPVFITTTDLTHGVDQAITTARRISTDSRIAVISADGRHFSDDRRVQHLTPWQAKGLEFDEVIVVEPQQISELGHGMSLLYVAITRATTRLTLVSSGRFELLEQRTAERSEGS